MKFKNMFSAFTILALTLVSFNVMAKKDGQCRAEIEKICPQMKMGQGLAQCLKANKDKFSEACKDKAQHKREKMRAAKGDCHADMKKLCGDVKKGEGRKIQCLKANSDKLSAECKTHLNKAQL